MPLTDAQIDYEKEPIPYTPVKRLERGPLYVRVKDIPDPIYGYSQYYKEYSVIDLRGYRKGYEPRLEILGVYTPNPQDVFRLGDGHLPPYQPTITGDKLQAEMERLGVFYAWRILPDTTSPLEFIDKVAIPEAETGTHPLVVKQYPIGEVPEKIEVGGLELPIPPPRKRKDVPENAVIRTSEKFDNTIKHLGYESVSFTQEELNGLGKSIPTDVDIINDSQRRLRSTEVISDEKLDSRQLSHLKLARVVANDISHTPVSVYAAVIPPASNRVRTAGLYGTTTGVIYINLDQLYSGRTTVDTLVHELGHHREYRQTGFAEDLSPAHAEAMTDVAARVVEDVDKGAFDDLLKEVSW